jgi:hypothetical protein
MKDTETERDNRKADLNAMIDSLQMDAPIAAT